MAPTDINFPSSFQKEIVRVNAYLGGRACPALDLALCRVESDGLHKESPGILRKVKLHELFSTS